MAMAVTEFEAGTLSVDATLLGESRGIEPSLVQVRMGKGKITSFCECGVGYNVGRYRLTFATGNKRNSVMEFVTPRPLKLEHEELHEQLRKATKESGGVGEAAKAVAKLMHPHFVKEEEYALPPLGLLPLLAKGSVSPDMANVLTMTDKLNVELDEMLAEHKSIVAALKVLADAAKRENKMEYVEFADKLILHAQSEEEVAYPTAILIGEYLKLKLNK